MGPPYLSRQVVDAVDCALDRRRWSSRDYEALLEVGLGFLVGVVELALVERVAFFVEPADVGFLLILERPFAIAEFRAEGRQPLLG